MQDAENDLLFLAALAINCYECTPQSQSGVANNCHIDDDVYGRSVTCRDQNEICYKETRSKNQFLAKCQVDGK